MLAKDWSLFTIAKRQHGVVSFKQARAVGFSKPAMSWRLRAGHWVRMLPSVVRLYWADDNWVTRCQAALLYAGAGEGALSHGTAARLHGFDVAPGKTVHVTMPPGRNGRDRSWLRCHHSRALERSVTVEGFRVTSPARTALDIAMTLEEQELARVLRLVTQHRQVSMKALWEELRCSKRGRGAAVLRRVLNRLVREKAS